MAIIVEQEKKPINWVNVLGTIIFIVLIFVLAYYVFFKRPDIVETVIPQKLGTLSSLKEVRVDPAPVLETLRKYFTTSYVLESYNPAVGRSNPFEPLNP